MSDLETKRFQKRVAMVYREVVGDAGPGGIQYEAAEQITLGRIEAEVEAGALKVPDSLVREQAELHVKDWLADHPETQRNASGSREPDASSTPDHLVTGRVRSEMAKRGISEPDVGHLLSIPAERVADLLEGRKSWSLHQLCILGVAFRVRPSDLLKGATS